MDSKNLEDLVKTLVKTMGYENCAVVADTTECSGIEQKCDSVVAIGSPIYYSHILSER